MRGLRRLSCCVGCDDDWDRCVDGAGCVAWEVGISGKKYIDVLDGNGDVGEDGCFGCVTCDNGIGKEDIDQFMATVTAMRC